MKREKKAEELVVLDAMTLAAVEEGIRAAEADPRRWTPEEVLADARKLAKEFRDKLDLPNSA